MPGFEGLSSDIISVNTAIPLWLSCIFIEFKFEQLYKKEFPIEVTELRPRESKEVKLVQRYKKESPIEAREINPLESKEVKLVQ
jgi:hypothetical protein